jgi:hypothetical protein
MSKLPFLIRGTGSMFDYIALAVHGNCVLGVKVVQQSLATYDKAISVTFRIRSAINTDEFIERITGNKPTEHFAPQEAFKGQWVKYDNVRASFMHTAKKSVSFDLADDGSFPVYDELGENLLRMIGSIFDYVEMPEGHIVITPAADLAEHIAKLLYPSFLEAYGTACHAKYKDEPPAHELAYAGDDHYTTSEASMDTLEGADEPGKEDKQTGDEGSAELLPETADETNTSSWGAGDAADYNDDKKSED